MLLTVLPIGYARDWVKVETDEFTLYSDCSQYQVENLAVEYTAFLKVFKALILDDQPLPRSTLVYFHKTKDLNHYTHPPGAVGYYRQNIGVMYLVDRQPLVGLARVSKSENLVEAIAGFETGHLLQLTGYIPPHWLQQAVGSVVASLQLKSHRLVIGADRRNYAAQIDAYGKTSWHDFFAGKSDSYFGTFRHDSNAPQAQAWALGSLLLLSPGETAPNRYRQLIASMNRESLDSASMQEILGSDGLSLDTLINRFFVAKPHLISIPFEASDIRSQLKFIPVPKTELDLTFSDLLLAANRVDDASAILNKVKARDPGNLRLKAALARRALINKDVQLAATYYDELVAADGNNPTYLLMSILLGIDPNNYNKPLHLLTNEIFVSKDDTEALLGKLRKLIRLQPKNEWAYIFLGRVMNTLAHVDESMPQEIDPGISNTFWGSAARYQKAMLLWRLKKYDEATSELRALINNPRSYYVGAQARVYLANQNAARTAPILDQLLKNNQYDEARKLIADQLSDEVNRFQQGQYERILGQIDERESWKQITNLMNEYRWKELHERATEFIEKYPRSSLKRGIEQMDKVAQRELARSKQ